MNCAKAYLELSHLRAFSLKSKGAIIHEQSQVLRKFFAEVREASGKAFSEI